MITTAPIHSNTNLEYTEGIWVEEHTVQRFSTFEDQYIKIRDKEQRIFSISEIQKLPSVRPEHKHAEEWKVRAKSIDRFTRFLKGKKISGALDIGCGTGFFANILSQYCDQVAGVEVNYTELRQAAAAFSGNEKLQWYYADIVNHRIFTENSFDLITFCCSFQYFPDVRQVLEACFYYLRPGGSVHIIDTPFYENDNQVKAKKATENYYHNMGCDELAKHYFHHTLEEIQPFKPVVRYQQGKFLSFLLNRYDSPFPWIEIIKP